MTAQAFNALTSTSLGADKIIRATTMQSLYDNPTAIAQRGSGAPWLNGIGAIAKYTTGSGNWTVPDGVYYVKVTIVGGGGGGQGSTGDGGNGGNTTFGFLTANGGGGAGAGGVYPGPGGTVSGADVGMPGQDGSIHGNANGGSSHMGAGGPQGTAGKSFGGGGGGSSTKSGGGGGATEINYVSVTPGSSISYGVGAGGTAGSGGGSAGAGGIVIIEY